MFNLNFRKSAFVFMLALLTMPLGNAGATVTSSPSVAATGSSEPTNPPGIVSGTDPEPTSPDVVRLILTILGLD